MFACCVTGVEYCLIVEVSRFQYCVLLIISSLDELVLWSAAETKVDVLNALRVNCRGILEARGVTCFSADKVRLRYIKTFVGLHIGWPMI